MTKKKKWGDYHDNSNDDTSLSSSPPLLHHIQLPYYLSEAFSDLYEEDGIVVLGKGMGWMCLLAAFCRFYADVEHGHLSVLTDEANDHVNTKPMRPPLVFVLGLRESERSALISTLSYWNTPPELLPIMVTNESGHGKDRSNMYKLGGIFGITTRILIVDLLTGVVKPNAMDGILLAHAETVSLESTTAFIVRIFRTQKRWISMSTCVGDGMVRGDDSKNTSVSSMRSHGFVKAFTDQPDILMSGFSKVDQILKSLFVRRLYLYPRFRDIVADELDDRHCTPHVVEFHQPLTSKMYDIQSAVVSAVQTCIREIKNATALIEWSDTDLTVENCVTTNFDMVISKQLEQDWHRLKPASKQLVNDLRTLRTLFEYLIQYDCITFWKVINSIKSMSAGAHYPSLWLLSPVAEILFRKAKERIYKIIPQRSTHKVPHLVSRLVPILEENPKWRLLRQILTEIHSMWNERLKEVKRSKLSSISASNIKITMSGMVLVMVRDKRSLESVRSYLVDGKDRLMTLRWLRYLEGFNDRSRAVAKGSTCHISEESRLLLEEESRARNFLFGANWRGRSGENTKNNNKNFGTIHRMNKRNVEDVESKKEEVVINDIPKWKNKKQKVCQMMGRGEQLMQSKENQEICTVLDESMEKMEHCDMEAMGMSSGDCMNNEIGDSNQDGVSSDELDLEKVFKVQEINELKVLIRTYSSTEGDKAYLLLNEVKPDFVVLYDLESFFIRALEIYSACSRKLQLQNIHSENERDVDHRMHVYFMIFEASSEEKNFLALLEREKLAFEHLIQHRKTMSMPLNTLEAYTAQEIDQTMTGTARSYAGDTSHLSINTKMCREHERKKYIEKRDIVVDIREFQSSLPSILHQGGMRLAPVTLTVGDFILSTVHCVERKSISDLFGSFASGRLYNQAESMNKHYKVPCLLLEFNPEKSFSLQNVNEIGIEIRTDNIVSKMSLLVIHFPKLRILWSRNPYETVKIFKTLKVNHEEADVEKAIEVGNNESFDSLLWRPQENETAQEMLIRLPGFTIQNSEKAMNKCTNIVDLVNMSRKDLRNILGPITGQKLFTFFRQKLAAM